MEKYQVNNNNKQQHKIFNKMKKIITIVIFVMTLCASTLVGTTHAQTLNLNITQIEDGSNVSYCEILYDSISFSKDPDCTDPGIHWRVTYRPDFTTFDYYTDNITIPFNNTYESAQIRYWGCEVDNMCFFVYPLSFENVPEPWTEETRWLNQGETLELEVNYSPTLNYLWPNGSTDWHYTITGPEMSGKVWVRMYNDCGSVSDTLEVFYNPEPATVTVDPNTNKNLVVWEIIPEQAEYISHVIINRDGVDMATVPYTDGQYLDNIGSDLAARVYTLRGVCPDGTQCPFPSRRRGTIHMAFLPDINGNVEMTWNQPIFDGAPVHVNRFEICEFDPISNEISVIDFVSSVTTSYSCSQSMFDYGYPLIRAVIEDGRGEKDMLSNRTEDLVGLNEMETGTLRVYPNPSNGVFNIEGEGTLHIVNVLGQEVMSKEIDGKTTIELPQGMYFVKMNGVTRKIVVE